MANNRRKGAGNKSAPKRTRAQIHEESLQRRAMIEAQKRASRVALINEYNSLKRKDITKLTRDAAKGDYYARSKMLRYSWAISTESNKRIAALEAANKAYGGRYNRYMYFLETEHEALGLSQDIPPTKARTPVELKLDWYAMRLQNDQAVHWLSTDVSTVEGQVSREKHRLERLRELEIVDMDTSYREAEEFLRWLGNEESSAAIDEWGSSEQAVEAFYDIYKEQGIRGLDIISKQFLEFKAYRQSSYSDRRRYFSNAPKTFDEAMERAGIKIEDYITGRGTS